MDLNVFICINVSNVESVRDFKEEKEITLNKERKYFSLIISLFQLLTLYIYDKYKFDYENTNSSKCAELNIYVYK